MDKKEILASLIQVANELDSTGAFEDADKVTIVAQRLAQWDDDFGGFERDDDYNVWEENEIARDNMIDRQDNLAFYPDMNTAIDDIRKRQANYGNEPYVLLRDFDANDDRNTSYSFMTLSDWDDEGSYLEAFRTINPGTSEELAPYIRHEYDVDTPLGMELDGGSDIDFN